MDLQQIAKATAKTLSSYLTYQAVRTVIAQLYETDPPLGIWLNTFSTKGNIQDGEAYLRELFSQRHDLALRVMTVRAHLAEEIADYLPELLRSTIAQANMEHRRGFLERVTGLTPVTPEDPEAPTLT